MILNREKKKESLLDVVVVVHRHGHIHVAVSVSVDESSRWTRLWTKLNVDGSSINVEEKIDDINYLKKKRFV